MFICWRRPETNKGVSRMMQAQGRKYVQYFNFTYGRTGTLWEGRYKSTLVDADNYPESVPLTSKNHLNVLNLL